MSNQYELVKPNDRSKCSYRIRAKRVNNTVVPELKETLNIASMPARVFPVQSEEELDLLTREYKHIIETGNIAIIYDDNSKHNQMYVWGKSGLNEGWELVVDNDSVNHLIDGGCF